MAARLVTAWGVLGVIAVLAQALWRLTPFAIDAVRGGLTPLQWVVLVVWTLVAAHAEGYRGFHRGFSPRVVARALYLGEHRRPLFVALAPLYCMALFHAARRRLIVARSFLAGLVVLIVLVRQLSQPWRGIVDCGVVVGLVMGVASILWFYARALGGAPPPSGGDLPPTEDAV